GARHEGTVGALPSGRQQPCGRYVRRHRAEGCAPTQTRGAVRCNRRAAAVAGRYNSSSFRPLAQPAFEPAALLTLPMPRSRPALLPDLAALKLPKPGVRLELPPLAGSADALAIAELAGRGQMLLVITANPLDAQRLREELAWVAAGLRLHLLPDWETLPYDNFSPHQDLISERLSTLYAVSRGEVDVLLVPASTALYRLAPPAFLAAYTFFLKQGERLDLDRLRGQMTVAGYNHVTQVVSPGEFSVRGGLLDLFPMGAALPYRVDLFDDEIESIKTFDPDTQRTVYPVPE